MTCEYFVEIAPLILNGSLSKDEEKEALEHIMHCADCREELAFWSQIAGAQGKEKMDHKKKRAIGQRVVHQEDAWDVTKKAVGLYFKVVKGVFTIG